MSKFCCLVSRLLAGRTVSYYANGTSTKMEQRISLKFLVKLKKSPTECLKLLKKFVAKTWCHGHKSLNGTNKRVKNGREKVEDDPKSGQPSISKTDDKIGRVKQLVQNDCRLTVWVIGEELGLNRESVQKILVDDLRMQKVTMHLHIMRSVWGSYWSKKKSQVLTRPPPYCPNLAPCDFWPYSRPISVVKGTHFSSSDEIKNAVTRKLKSLQ